MTSNGIHATCTHCGCHNPMWKELEDKLFDKEVIDKIPWDNSEKDESYSISAIYKGGTIRPMINGEVNIVEAIGMHNGKVVATGSEQDVIQAMKELSINFLTIELEEGQTLLPGLIEPHVHIVPTALMMGWHNFGAFDGQYLRDDYDEKWLTKELIANKPESDKDWILGTEVDPSLMPFSLNKNPDEPNQLLAFNCEFLDNINKVNPIMLISASMHTAYVNTPLLQIVYDSSEEVRNLFPTFQDYWKHVNEGNGLQEIAEMGPAFKAIPLKYLAKMLFELPKYFHEIFHTANQRGVTLMYDAGMTPELKFLLDLYLTFSKTKLRIGYAQICEDEKGLDNIKDHQPMDSFHNVYMGNVKLVSDGSNQGLTGYQSTPYCCEPEDNVGIFNFPPNSQPNAPTQEYRDLVKAINKKGWPLMIHANGDKAIDFAIDVYEEILNGGSGLDKRHRIEHCSLLNEERINRMRDLGISPSFLIGHVGYWGYVFREAIFQEKALQLDLCRSALDRNMRISFHSDLSVSPLGPLRMMEQSVTRIMEADRYRNVLNEYEKISREQALRAITLDAAWQCHADQWVGSLEAGKMADFVILSEDPLTRPSAIGLRDIPVLETWVDGKQVYDYEKDKNTIHENEAVLTA